LIKEGLNNIYSLQKVYGDKRELVNSLKEIKDLTYEGHKLKNNTVIELLDSIDRFFREKAQFSTLQRQLALEIKRLKVQMGLL
jgi:hypothetical protein